MTVRKSCAPHHRDVNAREPNPAESLLVFSDVHLGSDLNDRGSSPRRSTEVDQDLVQLVRHYLGKAPEQGRWRVVIAGDFIDFIGMSIEPAEGGESIAERTPEEQEHGLGSSSDHTREKLRRVVEIEPANVHAHHMLGALELRAARFDRAAIEFELVLKLEPERTLVRLDLADAQFRRGRTKRRLTITRGISKPC
jgi:hypothetical protein